MGEKSRGNYPVLLCIRACRNRGKKCHDCIKFSEYVAMETTKDGGME